MLSKETALKERGQVKLLNMKNLFFILFIAVFAFSCSKDSDSITKSNNIIDNSKAQPQQGLFLTSCDNQTWDGDINHDCESPASNCAVICGEVSTNKYYPDFVKAVKEGTSANFYKNGHGMDVLPITTEAYNDLINGVTNFYKVESAEGDKYALY